MEKKRIKLKRRRRRMKKRSREEQEAKDMEKMAAEAKPINSKRC